MRGSGSAQTASGTLASRASFTVMVASVKVTCRINSRSMGPAAAISATACSAAALSNSRPRGPTVRMPAASSAANARSLVASANGTSKVGRASTATP